MRMVGRLSFLAFVCGFACLLGLPVASWAQRDPINQHERPGRHQHSGDSQTVMQQYYGQGRTYFQGTPAFGTTAYGATLLPYDLPAGAYRNAANYPLQLSVQPTARVGQNPCFEAAVSSGSTILGRAMAELCNAVSTFTATVPAGAAFELTNGAAQVTALSTGASWYESGIVFDVDRNLFDGSGCEFSSYTGVSIFLIKNNLNQTRQETEPCPRTVLSPSMPPGIHYGTRALYPLQLSIRPVIGNVPGECWRLTVINQTTGQNLMDLRQPTPCPGFFDTYEVLVPGGTQFSMAGGNAWVTVLGTTVADWSYTSIVFPVTFLNFTYGDCRINSSGARVRTRYANYINNLGEAMQTSDEESCPA